MSTADTDEAQVRRVRLSQTDVPALELERALRLAHIVWDQFAGRPARPLQLAGALEIKPSSGGWRELTGASIAYGLTEGGYNAQEIKLTDLGRRIVAPRKENDDQAAKAEAALTPRVCSEFYNRYAGAKFPSDKIAASVLVDMGVPKERTERVVAILRANGSTAGLLQQIKGELYVELEPGSPTMSGGEFEAESSDLGENDDGTKGGLVPAALARPPVQERTGPRQLFVAHGKNMKPVEDLKKVLDQFKIPHKIAVDEAHTGRPISAKVAELMKSCSAGVFVFTKDEKFTAEGGAEIWRPSENVVYELGAGNVLWDQKIIVLRQEGVNFASDYSGIGYITFDEGGVPAKTLEILKELVGLGIVQVQAA